MVTNISGLRFNQIPKFTSLKEESEPLQGSNLEITPMEELRGLEAQAIYMSVSIANKKTEALLDVEYLPLIREDISIKKLQGEKIYNSHDELVSVVEKRDGKRFVYKPLKGNLDKISTIEIYDEGDNTLLTKQENRYYMNSMTQEVIHYNKDGSLKGSTTYEDGEAERTAKIILGPNGEKLQKEIHKNYYLDGDLSVELSSLDGKESQAVRFDEKLTPSSLSVHKETAVNELSKEVKFYNGIPYSIETATRTLNKNLTAGKLVDTTDLTPAESVGDVSEFVANALKDENAEIRQYSNGALESVIIGDTAVKFSLDGDVNKIVYPDKIVSFDSGDESIEEAYKDGEKITTYFHDREDDRVMVTFKNNTQEKTAIYNNEGIVSWYYESTLNDNHSDKITTMTFNEKGILEDVHSFLNR